MKILVGLGNPGSKYSNTKHNFGFWILDKLVENNSLQFKGGKGAYLVAKNNKMIFVKPTTYMNSSGIALLDITNYYKTKIEDFLVVYDDIDLPLGVLKYKLNGGTGGHKGIESIIYLLKSENFNRLRIGIGTNENMRPSEKFVLSPFRKKDEELKKMMINKACESIEYYLSHNMKEVMNKYNNKQERN